MKYLLLFIPIWTFAQQTTTIKVPPSKDTTLVIFRTTTTTSSNTSTNYTTATIPSVPADTTITPPPVITPGKWEGFGSQAIGGSQVVLVSNKAQFDAAVSNPNGKIIKFNASVTFSGRYEFNNNSYFTIDGNGFDVTINNNNAGDGISFSTGCHNIVLTGIRVTNAGNDCINVVDNAHDILIDHCSAYGGRDGNIDIGATAGINVTVQWCIIGDNQGSGKTLVTCKNVSLHHNLYASTTSGTNASTTEGQERNPYIHANYSPVGNPNCDFRNNVVVNIGRYGSGIGYKATANFINNYYTSSKAGAINLCADPSSCSKAFVSGNVQVGVSNVNSVSNATEIIIPDPFKVTFTDAKTAANDVKTKAGTAVKNSYEQSLLNLIQL